MNPIQKPVRTGQYGGGEEQEMLTYGPESYVPGDRYLNLPCQPSIQNTVISMLNIDMLMLDIFDMVNINILMIFSCRYDELGEGRASASNSDQTGTLSR